MVLTLLVISVKFIEKLVQAEKNLDCINFDLIGKLVQVENESGWY